MSDPVASAFASCSSPKFPCRTFGKCRPLCPAASTLPESSQQGDVGFTSTETLTTRKHLTRLYVGSSLALRPIPLSGKTPAHRSPFARLAVLIVCRFLYDIAPSAISSAELCLAYLWQSTVALKSDPVTPKRVVRHRLRTKNFTKVRLRSQLPLVVEVIAYNALTIIRCPVRNRMFGEFGRDQCRPDDR